MERSVKFFVIITFIWLMKEGMAVQHKRQRLTIRTSKYDTEYHRSFLYIPQHTKDSGIEDYEEVHLEKGFPYHLRLFCLCDDPRLCLFFDKKGHMCGVQISYILADVAYLHPRIYNFSNENFIDTNFYNTPCKSVRIYFTNPEELTEEGRNSTSQDIVEGLWTKLDGKLVRYDRTHQPKSPFIGDFSMQGCSPKIGQLFVKDMYKTGNCKNGFFLHMVYENRKLVGFRHAIPGIVSKGPKLDIFEYPKGPTLSLLFPRLPPCYSLFDNVRTTIAGFYIVEDPWYIRCPTCLCGKS